jgi:hypothetical protein
MVEQVGHRVVRTMKGDQVVAPKCRPTIALAACDEDDLALFIPPDGREAKGLGSAHHNNFRSTNRPTQFSIATLGNR